jgi:chemosensory pili system protein ChpA (sensor histidine kinase/response regulator)
MPDAMSEEITSDFVHEFKGYIPLMRDKLDRLKGKDFEASDIDLAELHRLVHAVRGASALIKLKNLSEVASALESVVEKMISGHLIFGGCVYTAATDTIEYFDAYTQQERCTDAFDLRWKHDCLEALDEVLDHATCDAEQDFLSQLIMAAHEAPDPDPDALPEQPQELPTRPHADTQDAGRDAPVTFEIDHQELIEEFYQEAEDHFQNLSKVIGELEQRVSSPTALSTDDKELFCVIRRLVHTIKGAAAVVNLKPIADWGHEYENILDWLCEDAKMISAQTVNILVDAADIFERLVTAPEKVDPHRMDQLRAVFKQLIGSGGKPQADIADPPPASLSRSAQSIEVVLPEEDAIDARPKPSIPAPSRPIRVDFKKVKSLVNLGGELTIALSAFDQDIDGLGNLIKEIEQTQARLKKTARDLEMGYEHKAIGKVATAGAIREGPAENAGETLWLNGKFDPLELDQYSELNLIIRSLNETAADAGTISQQLSKTYIGFKGYLHRLRMLMGELNDNATRMRMTPMSTIANRIRRTVRETASQLNKKVRLTIEGENIELDKTVWDKLADPLMHLLRNAVDHGVEPLELRKAGGKPETATINLAATQKGNRVILHISDDGGGLDYEAIRNAVPAPKPDRDKEAIIRQELAEMIFQPGFSTRQNINKVSGRGVGLDVVKKTITELNGSVHVEKSEKTGTTFCINLPITLAIAKALIFYIGEEMYATPLHDIGEVLRVNPKDLIPQGDSTIYIGGRRLLYYNLFEILTGCDIGADADGTGLWPLILIIEKESWKAAVAIDRIHSQRDIVLKSLGSHLSYVKGVSGATIMGDGKVVPILDLEDLLDIQTVQPQPTCCFNPLEEISKPLEILIVDDSVTIRNVISGLMQRQGWKVLIAKDGVEAVEVLHTRLPDVIILDIEMPRMNGYEFLSQIRNQDKFSDLPVIMHTSRASKKHREKAAALGANAFVTKPYEDDDLIAQVVDLSRKQTMA